MAKDVKVKINLLKSATNLGFGIPLILEESATKEVAYAECSEIADVVSAGFANTTKVYKAANLLFMQENPPKKIAVCATSGTAVAWLGDVTNVDKDWRQLMVAKESEAVAVADIIPVVETLDNKIFFASVEVDDKEEYKVEGAERTLLFYCKSTDNFPVPVAALVGKTAGKDAGSFTYKNLILKGIAPQALTDTEINAIHEKGGITFIAKAGDNVTSEGKVLGGEYLDIIDSEDYIIQQIEYKTQKLLNSVDKIPYTNNGIAMLESVALSVLRDAYNKGMIAEDENGKPAYTVNYEVVENVNAADRAERKYIRGGFKFRLAGAIHEVEITGEIEI